MRASNGLIRIAVLQAMACASGLILATPGRASADPAQFDITAQPLPSALKNFATQAKMQLLYRYDAVSHATANPVVGELEKHTALERLLEGTGLEAVYTNPNTATIRPISAAEKTVTGSKSATGDKPAPVSPPPTSSLMTDQNAGYVRLAQANTGTGPPQSTHSSDSPEPAPVPEIVVVGVRAALESAQEVKKDAPTFVDSITATDIGAFPDKSASDALQRLPGITVNRLQSNDDVSHPSGEPTNILIRGLTQVRTEFNGRDTFTADPAGRGINFNDISPELLARADAYKSQTADMIEGGIAGTVDLRTRLPFDQNGPVIVGATQADYGDRSNALTPAWSVLASDSMSTDFGRFGLLVDYARSHVITRTENVIDDRIDMYCTSGYGSTAHAIVNADGSIPCTGNPFGGKGWAFAPDGVRYSQVDYDRTRIGSTIAAQFENNSKTLLATLQYVDSSYHNAWLEDASHAILENGAFGTPAFNPRATSALAGGSPLVFGSNGLLQSGLLTQAHGSIGHTSSADPATAFEFGSAVPGLPFVNNCAPGTACARDGLYVFDETRDFNHNEDTKEVSAHVKWEIVPKLHADFDAQYVDSSVVNHDILVTAGTFADYQYSTGSSGVPQVTLLPNANTNYAAGGFSNPTNYFLPFIQGHEENDGGRESAFAMDAKYDISEGGWLDSLKAGVRYSDRNQTIRYSTFNWTPIDTVFTCNGPAFSINTTTPAPYTGDCAGQGTFKGYGAGITGTTNFSNFYDKGVYPNGQLVFLNKGTITNITKVLTSLDGAHTNAPGLYTSICDRTGLLPGSCFLPADVSNTDEQTKAAYVMLNFGGANTSIFGQVNVVGNVGVRVVQTEETASGSISYPAPTNLLALGGCVPPTGAAVVTPACYLTPAILAFSNSGGSPDTFKGTHTNVLPSFNVRFGLTDKDFVRFAYSKAISRPDTGLLRNYVQISSPFINTNADSPYVIYNSPTAAHIAANVVGYNFVFNSTAGNAALRPESADQLDLSYERYFGPTSSLTVGLFYKKLSNTLSEANFNRTFTNNGATETVQILGPINEKDGGRVDGVEFAYQTFFDFLPGLLSGLGMQANYTYVGQHGIKNSNLVDAGALTAGGVGAFGAGNEAVGGAVLDSHKLEGVSTHTFNLVGLYEKGPIGVRLAYNWRSMYLTKNLDCCIGMPVFQKAAGFLDGSVRYSIGSHVELSLDATNLLDTRTTYEQQIFGDSAATPGAKPVFMDSGWARVDRRYQLGVRVKF
jgi:TonB-dependent receptor